MNMAGLILAVAMCFAITAASVVITVEAIAKGRWAEALLFGGVSIILFIPLRWGVAGLAVESYNAGKALYRRCFR